MWWRANEPRADDPLVSCRRHFIDIAAHWAAAIWILVGQRRIARFPSDSRCLRPAGLAQCLPENLNGMKRPPAGAIMDLVTAARPWGCDQLIGGDISNAREKNEFADFLGYFVVFGLVAE